MSSWRINVFNNVIILLAMFSIVYLLIRLRTSMSEVLPIYFNFIVLATVTFVFVVIMNLISDVDSEDIVARKIIKFVHLAVIGSQWFIQIGIVIFMFQSDTSSVAVKRTCILSGLIAMALVLISFISYLFGALKTTAWIGNLTDQVVMTAGFAIICLLFCCRSWAPRPAALWWSSFQAVSHGLFMMTAAFYVHDSRSAAGHCVQAFSDLFYYCLYAAFLRLVVFKDSHYWRSKGALLGAYEIVQEKDPEKQLEHLLASGVQHIEWDELSIIRPIGSGNFGDIYLAVYRRTEVAVKKLRLDIRASQQKLMADLMQESLIFSKLRHPNLTLFIGVCTNPSTPALVTEYMRGGSLWDLIHPRNPSQVVSIAWDKRLRIMKDVAKGAAFLHGCRPPIIHRDLKSQNVLLDDHWNCKLCDFGLARLKSLNSDMSRVGTPQWMAPEVLREESYTESADIYSFGVLVWELVTLRAPFQDISPLRVIFLVAHRNERLPIPDTCPEDIRHLINMCWKPAEERPSFVEIIEYLERVQDVSSFQPRYTISRAPQNTTIQ
jgi:tRNA A-37 threonylcarbamoyl transferase component Bud32